MSEADDALAELLVALGARLARLEANVLGSLHVALTYSQYRILGRVSEGHHAPQVLASFASLTMPTVSEQLSGLVRRGLLTRSESPTDRRAMLVHITPEGRRAFQAGREALRAAAFQTLVDIEDDSARALLYEQLLDIHDRAEAFFPPPLKGVRRGPRSARPMKGVAQ